jgi:hypothetical protein
MARLIPCDGVQAMGLPDNPAESKKAKVKKSDSRKGSSGLTDIATDVGRGVPALVESGTEVLAALGSGMGAFLRILGRGADDAGLSLKRSLAKAADDAGPSLVRTLAKGADDLALKLFKQGANSKDDDSLTFTPEDMHSLQLFVSNTTIDETYKLITRINLLFLHANRIYIPSQESFVDSTNNITSINVNTFWHIFDLLNTVSDTPTPPSKDSPYELLAARLDEETRAFRQQVASTILPALKEEMLLRKHATYDDKRELVKWVNAELRRFDLTIKHPKTGNASSFVADTGNHPEEGRFQLRSEGEGGKAETFSTPKLSALLEVLELIAAPQRQEGLANWGDRTKDSSRPARGSR